MNKATELPQRKSAHLRDYDYSNPGYYFVTICTHGRSCLFGEVINDVMQLNRVGSCVTGEWLRLPDGRATVALQEFVVIPNHLHGIIELLSNISGLSEGAMNHAPTDANSTRGTTVGAQFIAPSYFLPTLGQIVRSFKARCSLVLRKEFGLDLPIWQRNYYDHVIRSEASLQAIREYIVNNPKRWALDKENPMFSNG